MSNGPPQPTDADKLLAVCRVVWPEDRYPNFIWAQGREMEPDSVDDLRRVLLALDKAQRSAFNHRFSLLMEQKKNGNICRPSPSRTLTAPTTQILDALHRAVCPE